jgi:hypothetical protein
MLEQRDQLQGWSGPLGAIRLSPTYHGPAKKWKIRLLKFDEQIQQLVTVFFVLGGKAIFSAQLLVCRGLRH